MVHPSLSQAQTPVALGPAPIATFLDSAGVPLAGCKIYTFSAGTNVAQPTFTSSSGLVQNANPTICDSAGRAQLWFSGLAYKIVVQDSAGSPQYTIDNFQISVFAAANNAFSGNNTFSGSSTFNGAVNIVNGGSLNGSFSGNPTLSGAVTFSGSLTVSQLILSVATGTPPLVVTSTTLVSNLNVQLVNGVSFPASPSLHSVPVITSSNVATYKVVPDCQTGTLAFTQATNVWSCTTATPGAVNCPSTKSGYALTFTSSTWSCTEIIPPVLKKGSNGGNYVAATGSFAAVDGTNLAYTVTIPTGSNLVVTANGVMSPTGGTSTWYVGLFDGATKLTVEELSWTAAGASNGCPSANCGTMPFGLSYVIAGDGISHTIQLEYAVEGASNDTTGRMLNTGGIFPTMLFTLQ